MTSPWYWALVALAVVLCAAPVVDWELRLRERHATRELRRCMTRWQS